MCGYNRKDAANEDERAINLTEEISVDYHQPSVPRHRSENIERGKGQTLSEILAIPRFDASTSRKKSNNYHCHGRLLTSEGFLAETRAKEEAKRTKEIAIEQKKLARAKKKKEKENHGVDAMVKKWIKEMEKKVD
jgi:hypothetical protein